MWLNKVKLSYLFWFLIHIYVTISLLSKNLKIKKYRTITLFVFFYGCETWSLTLREEGRLTVFENRVLRRIFGPKRDEETREERRLYNEELNDLYSTPSTFRVIKSRMRWAGHVARMGRGEAYTGFRWGKLKEKTTWETQA